jgi:hypothetical protein
LYFVQLSGLFMIKTLPYYDKEVVGVFVRFFVRRFNI